MPYNPGISYESGALSRGLMQAGDALGTAIKEKRQAEKQQADLSDALTTVGKTMGLWSQDQAKTMSLPQRAGALKGMLLKQEAARQSAQTEAIMQESALRKSEATAAQQEMAGQADFRNQIDAARGPGPVYNEVSPDTMWNIGLQTLRPKALMDLSHGLSYYQRSQDMGGMKLGETVPVGDLGVMVGAGPRNAPHFIPKLKSSLDLGQTMPVGEFGNLVGMGAGVEPKYEPIPRDRSPAQNYPFLYGDDDEFTSGIKGIKDPIEAQRVRQARIEFKRGTAAPDMFEKLLQFSNPDLYAKMKASKGAGATPGTTAPAPPPAAQPSALDFKSFQNWLGPQAPPPPSAGPMPGW